MSIRNVGEVFYILAKNVGLRHAQESLRDLKKMPLRTTPVPKGLVMGAAKLKAQYPVSYADAITAETAHRFGAPLVTGNPDFKPFIGSNVVRVDWIGN